MSHIIHAIILADTPGTLSAFHQSAAHKLNPLFSQRFILKGLNKHIHCTAHKSQRQAATLDNPQRFTTIHGPDIVNQLLLYGHHKAHNGPRSPTHDEKEDDNKHCPRSLSLNCSFFFSSVATVHERVGVFASCSTDFGVFYIYSFFCIKQ